MTVNERRRFWIAVVALVAAMGVLVVLITPAPDELPSTGPHSLNKTFSLVSTHFDPPSLEILSCLRLQLSLTLSSRGNLLSFTCARLC
jgi:hypothetical protein